MKLKSTVLSLMLTIFALVISPAYANDAYNEQKMYVTNESVQLMQDQIILVTEEGPLVAKALFSDEEGLFVYASDLETLEVKSGYFKSRCGRSFRDPSQRDFHERSCTICKLK